MSDIKEFLKYIQFILELNNVVSMSDIKPILDNLTENNIDSTLSLTINYLSERMTPTSHALSETIIILCNDNIPEYFSSYSTKIIERIQKLISNYNIKISNDLDSICPDTFRTDLIYLLDKISIKMDKEFSRYQRIYAADCFENYESGSRSFENEADVAEHINEVMREKIILHEKSKKELKELFDEIKQFPSSNLIEALRLCNNKALTL